MIRKPKALFLEIVRDAAGPDWILVRDTSAGSCRSIVGTDLGNAADAEQDAVQALIKRVAVVAVEEYERLVLLQLSPEVAEQFNLPVGFKNPTELPCPLCRLPGYRAFHPRRYAEVLLPQPAVG